MRLATTKKKNNYNFCPECEGDLISIIKKWEIVCHQCGLVISERIIDYHINYM